MKQQLENQDITTDQALPPSAGAAKLAEGVADSLQGSLSSRQW